ncbi:MULTISPECIES: hypothetical protein [unclassified Paludibacterium]|uniref:hypothetical protein n=1 Tax=unclassified Paludibacterium TaxID=2618429 RepID=UPI001C056FDF|nr:hypothetical protein [Paludibacterium sp. B53371]BEV71791.1 hypothetical protein THUN1379_12730 [Paludibacterium sp. THUN1379]
MLIRILSQPIVVSTSQSSRTTTSAEPAKTVNSASQDQVTLKSVLGQTISQWETAMAQYQQVAKKNLATLQRSNRSSRRAALAQRAENLKQRVKALQQMMSMASSHTAKGLAQELSRLAKELKSLASELKSLSGGSSGGGSQPINFSVAGQTDEGSSETTDSGDSTADISSASIDTSLPEVTSNVSADAGTTTEAGTDSSEAVDSSGQDKTDATVSHQAGSNSEAAADAQEKMADASLANALQELAAKLKGMRNMLKALVREQPGGKKLMDDIDRDFNDIDKAMADINDNTSQAELTGDSGGSGGQIDVSA